MFNNWCSSRWNFCRWGHIHSSEFPVPLYSPVAVSGHDSQLPLRSLIEFANRNLGILFCFIVFGLIVYLASTEFISAKKSKGEVLLFRRGRVPTNRPKADEESNVEDRPNVELVLSRERMVPNAPPSIQKQTAAFHWSSVNFDIKVKGGERRLLDNVDGWVKPGTLTALMVLSSVISLTCWN